MKKQNRTLIYLLGLASIFLQMLNTKTLDETVVRVQPGQTVTFETEHSSRIHSKFEVQSYELKEDDYHQQTHHEIRLYPPTYVLEIGKNAHPGTFKVVGKNDVGHIKTTKTIIVEPKKKRLNKVETEE